MVSILLLLVAVIWGIIIYRILNTLNSPTISVLSNTDKVVNNDTSRFIRDTFQISNNYRDPFLGTIIRANKEVNGGAKMNKEKQPKVQVATVTKWPAIVYNGMIRKKESVQMVALLKIDGKTDVVAKGSSMSGVQLVSVYKDSIQVIYEGEIKTIKK